jgi:hypothetical protein
MDSVPILKKKKLKNNFSDLNIKFFPLVLIIFIVNSAGFLLEYFDIDPYLIFLGFRFHLSFTLPFILLVRKHHFRFIKNIFLKPEFKGMPAFFAFAILPIFILTGMLFFFDEIKFSDPNYFYEFGLSSVIDVPLYLIWNTPQFFMLIIFLVLISANKKSKFFFIFFTVIFLFAYEFYTLTGEEIFYIEFIPILLSALAATILLTKYQNIYGIFLIFFFTFWSHFILFGTTSEKIIHLFFAKYFTHWEGFFFVSENLLNYLLSAHLLLLLAVLIPGILFMRAKA